MSEKISVGILGATGMVGQQYIRLLHDHPWFKITHLAASPSSAGKTYSEAVYGRWHAEKKIPENIGSMTVYDASDIGAAAQRCSLVFSAVEMDKQQIAALEEAYAGSGLAVVSNNSAHRWTPDVPMIIPEINPDHCACIDVQRNRRGWNSGLIVVKSNCSIQSYMTPLYALVREGITVEEMMVTTLQAISGAGYPGPSSYDMIDNIVPYIGGEEEKSEREPLKILGTVAGDGIRNAGVPRISAHCNRVPVIHGHTACASMRFSGSKPLSGEIEDIWRRFTGVPQELALPSAPPHPIIVSDAPDRPQPRFDRENGNGMAITVGRLRTCNVFDIRFVGLHHNTIRGAAGGCVLTAELLHAKGYV